MFLSLQVWPPRGLKKFETFSYLPDLTNEQLLKEIDYLLRSGWVPCLEFEVGVFINPLFLSSFLQKKKKKKFMKLCDMARKNRKFLFEMLYQTQKLVKKIGGTMFNVTIEVIML